MNKWKEIGSLQRGKHSVNCQEIGRLQKIAKIHDFLAKIHEIFKKWTPVPRGKAKAPGADDDGDEDYDPKGGESEKWSKEMLPFQSSRPEFMALFLDSVQASLRPPAPSIPHRTQLCAPRR